MRKKNSLLVSIITPVYNGSAYLESLIQSVLNQDYDNIEHIIIDDGSNDDEKTISILRKYNHLRWWTRPNLGQYPTMNEGLRAARGEIVCFICADDLMTLGAVKRAVTFLENHTYMMGAYGNIRFIDADGTRLSLLHPMKYMPTCFYPYSHHISHSSLYLRRQFINDYHLFFNENLRYVGDYEWIIRILRTGAKIGKLNSDLSVIRIHEKQTSNLSASKMRSETKVVQRRMKINPWLASFFRKIMFLVRLLNIVRLKGAVSAYKYLYERLFVIAP